MNPLPHVAALAGLVCLTSLAVDAPAGELPRDAAGRALNLDFEAGDLRDWDAEGEAFAQRPVKGDTVRAHRPDTFRGHQGDFWIGSYERRGDGLTGRLESAEFKVTQPWASFLVAGGAPPPPGEGPGPAGACHGAAAVPLH